MSRDISNTDDFIDSREIIERIEELQAEREALVESSTEAQAAYASMGEHDDVIVAAFTDTHDALVDWDTENESELKSLVKLQEQAEGYYDDWQHGSTLIRDSYFKDYAQELADDCGMIPDGLSWPMTCIDWDRAARELRMYYTSFDFDGVTYWVR